MDSSSLLLFCRKYKIQARPFRTQGTYSKYNSIDDKIDDLHYYTTFIKFGIGRATYDASQRLEIIISHAMRGKLLLIDSTGVP